MRRKTLCTPPTNRPSEQLPCYIYNNYYVYNNNYNYIHAIIIIILYPQFLLYQNVYCKTF